AAPAADGSDEFRGARVLLAEDNIINREVALDLLHSVGLAVDVAVDGAQALSMAKQRAYDAILLDVQMPVMSGLEAARAIRGLGTHGATPIIALTASAFADDRAECLDAGMNDHVVKPVDPDVLFATLRKWLHPQARAAVAAPAPAQPEGAGTRAQITPAEWLQLRELVAQLDALLAGNDMDANLVIREAAGLLGAALGHDFVALEGQISSFDYESALQTLRTSRAAIPELSGASEDEAY
ncbi:MAG TPA: response regulator, partial [Burkholderiaceae bacterium]|nr:response regulator [Burkholderiaceae bacterium]